MATRSNLKFILSVICLFLLFAASMTIYVMHREEANHIDLLNVRLQDYNHEVLALYNQQPDSLAKWESPTPDIRLTVINLKGDVIYESTDTVVGQSHPNHADRAEVKQALAEGVGQALIRKSSTNGQDYFYSATLFDNCIVRSAIPYNTELRQTLAGDRHYLYAAIFITIVLLALFIYMTNRMGKTEDANVELKTKLQYEQEYNQYKYELSHNVAHELKTPVASILGYLETILDARKSGNISDEQMTHFLERSYSQSQRLNNLVQDISILNKMSENRDVVKEYIDVSKLVRDILDEVALKLELQKMTVENRLPHELKIYCNQSMIYSIFRNLIDNALAYAGQGSKVEISFFRPPIDGGTKDSTSYYFSFADNGPGIPEEHLARIFERFYRVDKGRSRKLGGTGLGLAIVKNAVLLHGGNITAHNRPEGGLEFVFTLVG